MYCLEVIDNTKAAIHSHILLINTYSYQRIHGVFTCIDSIAFTLNHALHIMKQHILKLCMNIHVHQDNTFDQRDTSSLYKTEAQHILRLPN